MVINELTAKPTKSRSVDIHIDDLPTGVIFIKNLTDSTVGLTVTPSSDPPGATGYPDGTPEDEVTVAPRAVDVKTSIGVNQIERYAQLQITSDSGHLDCEVVTFGRSQNLSLV